MQFHNIVPTLEEIEAPSLEDFLFNNVYDIRETVVQSDDDFDDPPSRTPIPKVVTQSVHKTKVGQESSLQLKPLTDQVKQIEKTQEMLLK